MMLSDKIKEAMIKDFNGLYCEEFTTAWRTQRLLRKVEIKVMDVHNLEILIKKEIEKGIKNERNARNV